MSDSISNRVRKEIAWRDTRITGLESELKEVRDWIIELEHPKFGYHPLELGKMQERAEEAEAELAEYTQYICKKIPDFRPMSKDELDALKVKWQIWPPVLELIGILEATIRELYMVIWANKGITQEDIEWAGENEHKMALAKIENLKAELATAQAACRALVREWENGQPWPGAFEKVYEQAKEALPNA